MKRLRLALAALLPILMVAMANGQTIVNGSGVTSGFIKTTAHNFGDSTKYAWADSEICKPCHTPHNGQYPEISSRFWAHDLSPNSYKMSYVAPTGTQVGNQAPFTTGALDPKSRLCMGCHDGVTALDAFVGKTGGKGSMGVFMTGTALLGNDLSNDHPVGNDATYTNLSGAGTVSTGTFTNASSSMNLALWSASRGSYQVGGLYLVNVNGTTDATGTAYVVGCGTCHNPHGSANAAKTAVVPHLLRKDNTNSDLCLTCHKK